MPLPPCTHLAFELVRLTADVFEAIPHVLQPCVLVKVHYVVGVFATPSHYLLAAIWETANKISQYTTLMTIEEGSLGDAESCCWMKDCYTMYCNINKYGVVTTILGRHRVWTAVLSLAWGDRDAHDGHFLRGIIHSRLNVRVKFEAQVRQRHYQDAVEHHHQPCACTCWPRHIKYTVKCKFHKQ